MWSFRELIPEAGSKTGKVYKYDISIPVSKFKEVTDAVRNHLKELDLVVGLPASGEVARNRDKQEARVIEVVGYGHFGDGKFGFCFGPVFFSVFPWMCSFCLTIAFFALLCFDDV